MAQPRMANSTPSLGTVAAGFDSSTAATNISKIIPAILTPIASIIFVLILVASLKSCIHARNKRAKRPVKQPERKDKQEEPAPKKYINTELEADCEDNKDEQGRKVSSGDLFYQPIQSSSSILDFSSEEAQSEDIMISSPLGKYIMVEAEMHPLSSAKEERSSPKSSRSANFDEGDAILLHSV